MSTTRRAGTATVGTLTGLGLVVGLIHLTAPRWVNSLGLDVWNLPSLREDLRVTQQEGAVVDQRRQQIRHEIELADYITDELIHGRLTLAQATDRLEPMLRNRDGFECAWKQSYRMPSFRHGVAWYAIRRVEYRLRDDPARQVKITAQLEKEFTAIQ
jgi:hypothetical protein